MSPAPLSRRTLMQGAGAALGALALVGATSAALGAVSPPTAAGEAVAVAFDPAAFVADLLAAGCRVSASVPVPYPGISNFPPTYVITPPRERGFGADYWAVMARWSDAIDACPDHVERVVAHVFTRRGERT